MAQRIANGLGVQDACTQLFYQQKKTAPSARTVSWLRRLGPVAAMGLALSACGNPADKALDTQAPLRPAPNLAGAATPGVQIWRSASLAQYEHSDAIYLIPPVTVFHGIGSDYVDLPSQQVDAVAEALTRAVRTAVGRRFKVVDVPGPGVLRLDLVLLKVVPPHEVPISNGPYPFLDTEVGPEDTGGRTDNGVMTVAGKLLAGSNNKLLVAFVAPVTPQSMAAVNPADPAAQSRFLRAASEQFADNLVAAIVRQRQIDRAPTAS